MKTCGQMAPPDPCRPSPRRRVSTQAPASNRQGLGSFLLSIQEPDVLEPPNPDSKVGDDLAMHGVSVYQAKGRYRCEAYAHHSLGFCLARFTAYADSGAAGRGGIAEAAWPDGSGWPAFRP